MYLRLRARLTPRRQLECLLLWPILFIIILGCGLSSLLSWQAWWLIPLIATSGIAIWRGLDLRRYLRDWEPPTWRELAMATQHWRDLQALDDTQFIQFVAWLYQRWGYTTLPTGDGDQFLVSRAGGQRSLVTVAPYRLNADALRAIEHDVAATTGTGIIVTRGRAILPPRLYVARRSHLQLVDGPLLCDWIASWRASRYVPFDERAVQRMVLARVS